MLTISKLGFCCANRSSTCEHAGGITSDTKSSLLVTPQLAQQMWRRYVVFSAPHADVRHRLVILHQVQQTSQQLTVHAVWT